MISPYLRITKTEWYDRGGFANSALFRRHNGRHWTYWLILDAIGAE